MDRKQAAKERARKLLEANPNHFKDMQAKSMLNPNRQKGVHKGGFSYMTPKQLEAVSRKGGQSK